MRSLLINTVIVLALVFGLLTLGLAAYSSPMQEWQGNTTEANADLVLVVCTALVISIGLSALLSLLLWPRQGRTTASPTLRLLLALQLGALLLLGVIKWFPWYEG